VTDGGKFSATALLGVRAIEIVAAADETLLARCRDG